MADVEPGDIVLIRAKQLMASEKVMNTYYVRHSGGTAVSFNTYHSACLNWMQGAYDLINNLLHEDWASDTISTYNITQDLPMLESDWLSSLTGEGTTDSLPLQNAALVTFPTDAKRSLGKKFIVGIAEAMSGGGGTLTSTFITALQGFAADILAGHTQGDAEVQSGNWRVLTENFVPYVGAIVEALISSQRRRKPGVGE